MRVKVRYGRNKPPRYYFENGQKYSSGEQASIRSLLKYFKDNGMTIVNPIVGRPMTLNEALRLVGEENRVKGQSGNFVSFFPVAVGGHQVQAEPFAVMKISFDGLNA